MKLDDILVSPLYSATMPSTKKKVQFRAFVVKEERALLAAHESEDPKTMILTLNQVISNCISPIPKSLTHFDLEYMFSQIRAKSVGEISTLIMTCDSCSEKSPVNINLETVFVKENPDHKNKVRIDENIVIQMRFPSVKELIDIETIENEEERKFKSVCSAIDTIFVGDEAIKAEEETPEAITNFLNRMTKKQFEPLTKFFEGMPEVVCEVNYSCPHCRAENKKTLKGLSNFFS